MSAAEHQALEYAVAGRPFPGETESGDLHAVIPCPRGYLIAVADGLGHGPEARFAAELATVSLATNAHLPLPSLMTRCHEALLRTRGVAISVAFLESFEETMTWLSIGNVSAILLRAGKQGKTEREHVLMRNGVLGHRLPALRAATLQLRPGDLLLFATDGVREGFETSVRLCAQPQQAADDILTRYAKTTDDALVLVGRWHGPAAAGERRAPAAGLDTT